MPIGHWPPPPPCQPPERVALWLDGSLASAVCAALLDRAGLVWLGLLPADAPSEAGRLAAARAASTVPLPAAGPFLGLSGWAAASEAALAAGARWLVSGLTEDEGAPPPALRLVAIETAIRAYGLEGVYAPLLGHTPIELGRLALALGVPFEGTRDCLRRCGDCGPCRRRALMFHQLGMTDPAAPKP